MIKRIYRKVEYRLGPAIFGNTLGFEKNKVWRSYHNLCRQEFSTYGQELPSKAVGELKKDRLSILSRQDVTKLALQVSNYFGESDAVYSEMSTSEAVKNAKYIFEILKKAERDVINFYGSYFQPYWIKIQRTNPGKTTAASSFGWHIDDNHKELMKLFVYLNDVSESNGAFRAFPWSHSRRILLKGFRSNGEATRVAAQPIADKYLNANPRSLKILEGIAGTVLSFDNNLVHKGTAPRMGYRDAIQIPVYPSKVPLTLEMIQRALLSPQKRDYPMNPEENDFGY